jgi:hypothetical protein
MPGEQEKFSIVSRAGIPNSRGKAEIFSITKDERQSLLEEKPNGISKSMYWSYLIKKGNQMLVHEKDNLRILRQLAEDHNAELVNLLENNVIFDEIVKVLEKHQKELDEVAALYLEEF